MLQERAAQSIAIRRALSPSDVALAHALFVEYAQWLQVDLCFQGFEEELATLPGVYAPPHGCLLLAGLPGAAFGCIALRPLGAASRCDNETRRRQAAPLIGEVKRLFIQPPYQGQGWGRHLACAVCDAARALGYRELRLDTLAWMTAARALYAALGFRECAPYYDSSLAGTVYMALIL